MIRYIDEMSTTSVRKAINVLRRDIIGGDTTSTSSGQVTSGLATKAVAAAGRVMVVVVLLVLIDCHHL